ncbi:hypothetical protein CYMTET_51104 [Cymbomonas tetramitiformis]|uniref:Uncharacterized protein n=1 Tax=Cymbomonas tetramitiformis TaxID=36881 RepID=A0AAE0ESZ9_9CHLO|nr:hypothetical protein CYMTET_51104 [Cymbomonas tetramitiformis]
MINIHVCAGCKLRYQQYRGLTKENEQMATYQRYNRFSVKNSPYTPKDLSSSILSDSDSDDSDSDGSSTRRTKGAVNIKDTRPAYVRGGDASGSTATKSKDNIRKLLASTREQAGDTNVVKTASPVEEREFHTPTPQSLKQARLAAGEHPIHSKSEKRKDLIPELSPPSGAGATASASSDGLRKADDVKPLTQKASPHSLREVFYLDGSLEHRGRTSPQSGTNLLPSPRTNSPRGPGTTERAEIEEKQREVQYHMNALEHQMQGLTAKAEGLLPRLEDVERKAKRLEAANTSVKQLKERMEGLQDELRQGQAAQAQQQAIEQLQLREAQQSDAEKDMQLLGKEMVSNKEQVENRLSDMHDEVQALKGSHGVFLETLGMEMRRLDENISNTTAATKEYCMQHYVTWPKLDALDSKVKEVESHVAAGAALDLKELREGVVANSEDLQQMSERVELEHRVLNEMRTGVAVIEKKHTESAAAELCSRMELLDRLHAAENAAQAVTDRVSLLERFTKAGSRKEDSLSESVDELKHSLQDITALQQATARRTTAVEETSLPAVDRHMDSLRGRIAELESARTPDQLQKLDQRLTELHGVPGEVQKVCDRVTQLEATPAEVQKVCDRVTQLEATPAEVQKVCDRVTQLEATPAEIAEGLRQLPAGATPRGVQKKVCDRVTQLEATPAEVQKVCDRVTQLEATPAEVQKVCVRLTQLEATPAEVQKVCIRLSQLEDSFPDRVRVLDARLASYETATGKEVEQLQAQVAALGEQVAEAGEAASQSMVAGAGLDVLQQLGSLTKLQEHMETSLEGINLGEQGDGSDHNVPGFHAAPPCHLKWAWTCGVSASDLSRIARNALRYFTRGQ